MGPLLLKCNNRLELLNIKNYKVPDQKYLPLKNVSLKNFSANELIMIDQIIGTYTFVGIEGIMEMINKVDPLLHAEEEGEIVLYPH